MNAVIGFSELLSKMVTDKRHKSYLASIQTAGKTLLIKLLGGALNENHSTHIDCG